MRLDHVNIRCSDLDTTRDFLRDVIGLKVGNRPAFPFPGYWMTDETGGACAHLVLASETLDGVGPVDHVAFYFDDLDDQVGRMAKAGYEMALKAVPGTSIRQGFVDGPDGVKYEIQGPAA